MTDTKTAEVEVFERAKPGRQRRYTTSHKHAILDEAGGNSIFSGFGEAFGAAVDGLLAVTPKQRTRPAALAHDALGARGEGEAATFLTGCLRETFPMTDSAAPAWKLNEVAPTSDIAGTLRRLSASNSKVD